MAEIEMLVFSGPTLAPNLIRSRLSAEVLGPIRQGDLVWAIEKWSPRKVAIIDGYYETVPSVWYKEILFALSQGIEVYGAGSIGALRAAELDDFGMVGIGRIYKQFKAGVLEDDDEVALLHGPEEVNFLSTTLPMVNIRESVAYALQINEITVHEADRITSIAKSLFFKRRTISNIIFQSVSELGSERRPAFERIFKENYQDLKKADALKLINHLSDQTKLERNRANFTFHSTCYFESLRNEVRVRPV